MLKVEALLKQYGDFVAVDGVSFEAGEGTVFGLLGPNGAGKSSTINCISGLLAPTSGHISVQHGLGPEYRNGHGGTRCLDN